MVKVGEMIMQMLTFTEKTEIMSQCVVVGGSVYVCLCMFASVCFCSG